MIHRIETIGGKLAIIRVGRELESGSREAVNALRNLTQEQITVERHLILDFAKINVCPSVVWGNLIVHSKRAREKGLRVLICCLRPTLEKSVRIIKMNKYVTVCGGVDEARQLLAQELDNG